MNALPSEITVAGNLITAWQFSLDMDTLLVLVNGAVGLSSHSELCTTNLSVVLSVCYNCLLEHVKPGHWSCDHLHQPCLAVVTVALKFQILQGEYTDVLFSSENGDLLLALDSNLCLSNVVLLLIAQS